MVNKLHDSLRDDTASTQPRSTLDVETFDMELADVRIALGRIQSEYTEMPEMKLTLVQVRRLLGLPPEACDVALATLVQAGFLVQARDGAFLRGTGERGRLRFPPPVD
jgi:hypothetical protein